MLCDVVSMQARHLLLGRPWQFDRRVKYEGFTNKYSFVLNQQPITLVPLTPQQVYEDQVRLQKESDQKKESEQKKMIVKERQAEEKKREKTVVDLALREKHRENKRIFMQKKKKLSKQCFQTSR